MDKNVEREREPQPYGMVYNEEPEPEEEGVNDPPVILKRESQP